MTRSLSDLRMDHEHPNWGGLDPRAATSVFADLTSDTHLPVEVLAKAYWDHRAGEDALAQRRVAEASDDATVSAYYAETPRYLYELSYWEACHDKQSWFRVVARFCKKYRLKNVLDFGGGVGGLTLFLRTHGIHCDYLDVPGKTFDYAARRFAKRNFNVTMRNANDITALPWQSYDAVVAWDVLEHIFELDKAIETIARLLRPKGWFLSKSTFAVESKDHHEHVHLAKHACYADVRRLNQLFTQFGFSFRGQLKPSRFSRLLNTFGLKHAMLGIRIAPRLKHGGNFLIHVLENIPTSLLRREPTLGAKQRP